MSGCEAKAKRVKPPCMCVCARTHHHHYFAGAAGGDVFQTKERRKGGCGQTRVDGITFCPLTKTRPPLPSLVVVDGKTSAFVIDSPTNVEERVVRIDDPVSDAGIHKRRDQRGRIRNVERGPL